MHVLISFYFNKYSFASSVVRQSFHFFSAALYTLFGSVWSYFGNQSLHISSGVLPLFSADCLIMVALVSFVYLPIPRSFYNIL